MNSPYSGKDKTKWHSITKKLIKKSPIHINELIMIVQEAWEDINNIKIGREKFKFGKEIFPKPQILGFFLHELIPLKLSKKYPQIWRPELEAHDKDIVNLKNQKLSIEIKTSSNKSKIYGNRSYAQKSHTAKKTKSGYYLAINFEKVSEIKSKPKILKIRFGWLDHDDWKGQSASTGQQASLSADVENYKLIEIYPENRLIK